MTSKSLARMMHFAKLGIIMPSGNEPMTQYWRSRVLLLYQGRYLTICGTDGFRTFASTCKIHKELYGEFSIKTHQLMKIGELNYKKLYRFCINNTEPIQRPNGIAPFYYQSNPIRSKMRTFSLKKATKSTERLALLCQTSTNLEVVDDIILPNSVFIAVRREDIVRIYNFFKGKHNKLAITFSQSNNSICFKGGDFYALIQFWQYGNVRYPTLPYLEKGYTVI